jgi:hypothetical protein
MTPYGKVGSDEDELASPMNAEIALLLELIDRSYDRTSWHGPVLRGSIRGVQAPEASWRPAPGRHNIAEQIVHAAYWKYAVRRRLLRDKRGSFPLPGSNWFALPDDLSESDWRGFVGLLESEHVRLRAAVAGLSTAQLESTARGGKFSNRVMVFGIAQHDVYHAGQIQLLKRLQARA